MANSFRIGGLTALLLAGLTMSPTLSDAQVMGDEAELGRLQSKAEEAIGNDDADGAAMMMGRAALLAAQLGKREAGSKTAFRKSQEALFRSQEHTYRAMALFRRAGGQLPASSGVCGSLALARTSLGHVTELDSSAPQDTRLLEEDTRLRASADTWRQVVDSIIAEYHCL
ncbi:hypothetical protein [Nitrospira lenta]|uniref:Uncharacterized protein n=1 Tax=Nitrospira lenta TaxID=1436998 RepID=A0A330L9M5_9BACT|nr:hypothetical protein [Nitrospira lenta]SPP65987.1 conserved exported hypothetical protein [Nitrospira lenta]